MRLRLATFDFDRPGDVEHSGDRCGESGVAVAATEARRRAAPLTLGRGLPARVRSSPRG